MLISLAFHGLVLTPLALNLFASKPQRPASSTQPSIYIDILPRPLRLGEPERVPIDNVQTDRKGYRPRPDLEPSPRQPVVPSPPAIPVDPGTSVASVIPPDDRWRVRPDDATGRIGPPLHRSPAGCRMMIGRLDAAEQAWCDQILADAAARSAPIIGTNDPVRDARFAALGDQALADYDRRRAPLKPNSRANPCPESPNPGDPCAFTIKGRLWSSRDGILPDLPGRQ